MTNVKYLDTHLITFSENKTRNICKNGSMVVSITTILNALREYEVGIPKDYYERDGVYWGIANWLSDEEKKGNIVEVYKDNTYDLSGSVSIDFGFAQYDSLVSEDSFVMMHIHNGAPFLRESSLHNRYPAMLFKFKKGTSFYNVLDDITFESPDVSSMLIQINGNKYLVLPRVVSESYYVKCLETGEELEPTDEICFNGNEGEVREQIKSYIKCKKWI